MDCLTIYVLLAAWTPSFGTQECFESLIVSFIWGTSGLRHNATKCNVLWKDVGFNQNGTAIDMQQSPTWKVGHRLAVQEICHDSTSQVQLPGRKLRQCTVLGVPALKTRIGGLLNIWSDNEKGKGERSRSGAGLYGAVHVRYDEKPSWGLRRKPYSSWMRQNIRSSKNFHSRRQFGYFAAEINL